jgi:hypothetical protein
MNSFRNSSFLVLLSLSLATVYSCASNHQHSDEELLQLAAWMSGSFSSQAQSEADTNFYDIRLEMAPIWEGDADTLWLYVEQAVADYLDKPYRQRVYRLCRVGKNSFESAVFSLEDPLRFAGAWKEAEPLSQLSADSLLERSGCALILYLEGGSYEGITNERDCSSTLRGASYATSEVVVTREELTSLDQGFDQDGEQVWGSEFGPYIFKKLK